MGVLFVFFDGVGLGRPEDPDVDPFGSVATPTLDRLAGGSWTSWAEGTPVGAADGVRADGVRADGARAEGVPAERIHAARLDATLGVPGLPQSATGQSALLSGRDAVAAMNGHYGPWPGPTLKRFLAEGELFAWATARFGVPAVAWGAGYPPGFFEALERGRLRLNVPAFAAREAGVVLPDLDAYRRGEAVAADLDGSAFARGGLEPPGGHREGPAGAEMAGRRLARIAADRAFTFLDVWGTDQAGHRADLEVARSWVARLDAFVAGVLMDADPGTTVVITSDHGNLEDLSHGRHTRAPVPLIVVGPGADGFVGATTLLDVAPGIVRAWSEAPTRPPPPVA